MSIINITLSFFNVQQRKKKKKKKVILTSTDGGGKKHCRIITGAVVWIVQRVDPQFSAANSLRIDG